MTTISTQKPASSTGADWIRWIAAGALAVLMLGLAVFNVRQWLNEGFVILAVVALCAELIGFVMAVMIELAAAARRWLAVAVCTLILAVCAGFNVIGFERAWEASVARHLEAQRLEAQAALDATRAEHRQKLADANRRIASYDHLLPDGDTVRARQAGLQAAWDRATAQARADAAAAQAELDRLPVVAQVDPPFAAWQVQLGGALAELIKALGLWACGFGVSLAAAQRFRSETTPHAETAAETGAETPQETLAPAAGNVLSLAERAKALRAQGPTPTPYAAIARALGCSKKHAWTLVNAG